MRLNSSRLVLKLVFNKPAAVDHILVSVLLLRGRPLAAFSEMIYSLAPVSMRALTNLFLVCLFFLPVECFFKTNRIFYILTSFEPNRLCWSVWLAQVGQ